MNNTKNLMSTVAVLIAATLVVGTFAVTTTIGTTQQSAFAFSKNKKGDENSKNGNTITALKCQNKGSASGFDTTTNQECENLICTHPGENATCVQEGLAATTAVQQGNQTTTPVKLTCEQCFTKFLNAQQIEVLGRPSELELFCARLPSISLETFERFLTLVEEITGQPIDQAGLIQCLQNAGITFATTPG